MDVMDWACRAQPGETVVYTHMDAFDMVDIPRRWALETARKAHVEGLVFLAQRRRSSGFDYEATRISEKTATILGLV